MSVSPKLRETDNPIFNTPLTDVTQSGQVISQNEAITEAPRDWNSLITLGMLYNTI